MKKTTRIALVAAAIIATTVAGVVLTRNHRPSDAPLVPAPTERVAAATLEEPAAMAEAPCRFLPGRARAWRIDAERKITIDASAALGYAVGAAAKPSEQTSRSHAALQVEVLKHGDDGAVVLARLWDVDAETSTRAGDLSAPFLLRIGLDCSISGFARYKKARILAARTQQATVQDLWFSVPASGRAVVKGADSIGEFEATVATAKSETNVTGAQRRITAYRRLWDNRPATSVVVDNSFATIERDQSPWFRALHATHQFHGEAIIRGETDLTVTEQKLSPQAFSGAPRAESDYVWENLLPRQLDTLPSSRFTEAEKAAQSQLQSVTPEEALRRLRATVAEHKGIQSEWKDLSTYFEARPDKIPEIAEQLLHEKLEPRVSVAAFVALGMARVPEARDALFAMNQSAGASLHVREQTVLLLAARRDATTEIAVAVRQDAATHGLQASPNQARYARTALLAMGMMGDTNRETNPRIRTEAIGVVKEVLPRAESVAHLSPVFGSIGNLGEAELLPEVRRFAAHPNPDVRAIAVKTMRRLPLSQVSGLMTDWLARETEAGPKRELYTHLRDMTLDQRAEASDEVVRLAVTELRARPGLITRSAIIDLLGPFYAKKSEVRDAFLALLPVEARDPNGAYQQLSSYIPEPELRTTLAAAGLY